MIFRGKLKFFLQITAVSFVLLRCVFLHAAVIDKVIVVVNDEVVTQREFDRAFAPIKQSYENNFEGEELKKRLEDAKKGLLEQLINSKLAVSLAKKEKMEVDEEKLEERVSKVRSFYPSEEDFLQALSSKGTNLTEFKRELSEQMLAQKLVEKEVASKIIITPSEIKDLYDKNKEQLVSPVKANMRGIMVRKKDDSAEGEDRKEMEEIISELDKGKDFAQLARERSEGPYAEDGGDMGYVSPGQMVEEIDKVIFKLKEGERTDIIETSIGYHVFLVEEIQPSRILQLSEVNNFLKDQLFMRRFETALIKWLEEERKKAYISYK